MKPERNITIALAQMKLTPGQPELNFEVVKQNVKMAARKRADLVLLPELWASGYDLENCKSYATDIYSGWFEKMRLLAAMEAITLGGSLIESDQGSFYNTFALFDHEGEVITTYRKIHLFQPLDEERYFTAGKKLVMADTPWGKVGLATCFDLRFPEMFSAYAVKGVELILLVAEWPLRRIAHWHQLLKARAIENQCFIAAVNKVGITNGEQLGGGSVIVNPMGEELSRGTDKEEVILATVNLEEVRKTREWMPVVQKRKPAVYQDFLNE